MKKSSLCACAAIILAASCNQLPSDEILQGYNWSVQMESSTNPKDVINIDADEFTCEEVAPGEFRYTNADAEVVLKWSAGKNTIEVTPTVTNLKEGWIFTSMIGPLVPIQAKIEEQNLLMPIGFGEKFTETPRDAPEFLKSDFGNTFVWAKHGKYFEVSRSGRTPYMPSRLMTMQWCAFAGPEDGVYIASHDPDFSYKSLNVRYYPEEDLYRFALRSYHILSKGESCTLPTTTVRNYKGDWHVAADMYREWYESVRQKTVQPEWLKKSTGWLLTILKQQNDEIMWPYPDVRGCLADAAEARGLDIIGLFGWTVGGHDRFYPEYDICPRMGGEAELRESLKALHERGMHSIIYVNGQLQDMDGTKYWWENVGRNITVINKDGSYNFETWHKYSDAPARRHGRPCHLTPEWREKMLELAKMANDLGADGIIFDQLGVGGPALCYSPGHGHKVPAITFEQDRTSNLAFVQEEMAKINPEFIVMTEGTTDAERNGVDIFHGCTYGTYDPSQKYMDARTAGELPFEIFPEMLKYTHPDIECTQRHPSPVADRMLLNYGTVYGFKHEIESRYAADRKYLLEDHIPVLEDYGNVLSKPNISMMQTEDAVAQRIYSKQVLNLRKKYSDCLLEGTFKDDLGLACDNPSVIAKVFEAVDGSRAAVVVWNTSEESEQSCNITLKGRKLVCTDSPEGPVEGSTIKPQSIHVLIFE